MSPALTAMLLCLCDSAKQNHTGPVACCWCGNKHLFVKYGKYSRYDFSGKNLMKIQRYLCRHDICRRTFSILPHPFLRITHFSLCMINVLLDLLKQQVSRAEIARHFHMSWPTIVRMIEKGRFILDWIKQESQTDPVWAPLPCMAPAECWSRFITMFAAKFYPKRYGYFPSTQHEYLL